MIYSRGPCHNIVAINRKLVCGVGQTSEPLVRQSCTYHYYYVLMPQISNIKCKKKSSFFIENKIMNLSTCLYIWVGSED